MDLKIELEKRKMSQYRLAKLSGVSQPYICHLVSGKRKDVSMKIASKLAAALNMSLSELSGDNTTKKIG